MHRLALLSAFLLLVGCNSEKEYQRRRHLAATQPPAAFGFKLKVGTPRAQVLRQLDSLRQCHALGVRIRYEYEKDSVVRLPFEAHPVFTADKLTSLQLVLPKLDKWQWVGVLDSLRNVYGGHTTRFMNEDEWYWYWFAAGTEIEYGRCKSSQPGQWYINYESVAPRATTPKKTPALNRKPAA